MAVDNLKIEYRPISEIRGYSRNARTHPPKQVEQLAASIKEFGFTNPILVSESGEVIAGHGRLEAAKLLGLGEVPTISLCGLSETQRKALVLADNRIAESSGWNKELLSSEFLSIQAVGFDLGLLGFSDAELSNLIQDGDGDGSDDAANTVPDVQSEATTKPADVWILGGHRLICGDATKAADIDKVMSGKKADMVLTDPPYGVDYEGIHNDSRGGLKNLLDDAFKNYVASTKPGGSVYLFHSDRCADIFHEVFRKYCHFSSCLIWVKPALVLSQTDYQSRHEPCMYGWIEGGTHHWHADRKQTSILEYGKEQVSGHTTPKPVEMLCYLIKNSSKKNAVVSDFFGGSGSTLIAAEKTGRIARMIELDPIYCDVIVRRWQEYTGKKAVRESDGVEFDYARAQADTHRTEAAAG